MDIQKLIEELKEAELQLRAAMHEDGGLYSTAKWRVDELKVKLFDAIGGVGLLDYIAQLEAERDAAVEDAALAKCLTCGHKKKYEAKGINCYPEESCDVCDAWFWHGPARKG